MQDDLLHEPLTRAFEPLSLDLQDGTAAGESHPRLQKEGTKICTCLQRRRKREGLLNAWPI